MSSAKRMLIIGEPGQLFRDFFEGAGYKLRSVDVIQAASLSTKWRPHVVVVDPCVVPDLATFTNEVRWSDTVLVVGIGSASDDRDLTGSAHLACIIDRSADPGRDAHRVAHSIEDDEAFTQASRCSVMIAGRTNPG